MRKTFFRLQGVSIVFAILTIIFGVMLAYGGPDESAVLGLLSFGIAVAFCIMAIAEHPTRR